MNKQEQDLINYSMKKIILTILVENTNYWDSNLLSELGSVKR